ncbi:hypothetical protein [Haliea sp.]|uniref:hypothetical protein n=1 Tax=Haliea sp. TaxID=1932666 RepID=UPI0032ED5564
MTGFTGVRFHDPRHTVASNVVSAGRTLFETGTLLGHKQNSTTMRYAHLVHHHMSKMAAECWLPFKTDPGFPSNSDPGYRCPVYLGVCG